MCKPRHLWRMVMGTEDLLILKVVIKGKEILKVVIKGKEEEMTVGRAERAQIE